MNAYLQLPAAHRQHIPSAGIGAANQARNSAMAEKYEDLLKRQLLEYDFQVENICMLDRYDPFISEKVLSILLEWACYGQNISGILMGRKKIAEIPKAWLKTHLTDVVKNDFEYWDDWNYRRLLEVATEVIPELKDAILSINAETNDQDQIEVIHDFK